MGVLIPTFTSIRGILPCWSPREIIVEVLTLLTVTSLGVVCTNTLTMNLKQKPPNLYKLYKINNKKKSNYNFMLHVDM